MGLAGGAAISRRTRQLVLRARRGQESLGLAGRAAVSGPTAAVGRGCLRLERGMGPEAQGVANAWARHQRQEQRSQLAVVVSSQNNVTHRQKRRQQRPANNVGCDSASGVTSSHRAISDCCCCLRNEPGHLAARVVTHPSGVGVLDLKSDARLLRRLVLLPRPRTCS